MTASPLRNSASAEGPTKEPTETSVPEQKSGSAEGRAKEPTETPVPEQKQDAGVHGKADANAPAPLRGMKRSLVIIAVLVVAAGGGALAWWWLDHRSSAPTELVLYGNVDIRQVRLGFRVGGRIAEMLVDEGDTVNKGALLAHLDARPYDRSQRGSTGGQPAATLEKTCGRAVPRISPKAEPQTPSKQPIS